MKKYKFIRSKSGLIGEGREEEVFEVEEKYLEQWQKDLLLGELIKLFNDSPDEIQTKFLQQVADSVRNKISPQKQKFMDEQYNHFVKLIDSDIQKEIIKELRDGKK